MKKIFICTSFSSKISSDGNVLSEHRDALEPLFTAIRQAGFECFCAIEDEGWKITKKDPTLEFKHDLDKITDSDIMLALLENEVSAGVQIEIGCMLGEITKNSHKQLVLAHPVDTPLAWSNNAISKLPGVSSVQYSDPVDIIDFLLNLPVKDDRAV
jgi:hypothetical protein